MGKKESKVTAPQSGTVVYIGPNLKYISSGTALNNGLTEELKQAIEKTPMIEKLVVPVTELARSKAELKERGSQLNVIYNMVLKEVNSK